MSRVYSDELFVAHDLSAATLNVPVGERWVVRTVTSFGAGGLTAAGYQIVDNATGATILYTSYTTGLTGEWQVENDLRVVFKEGAQYDITGFGPSDLGLYGYRLTLP